MGDKTAEGYPLSWEDGDQITITDGTTTGTYQLVAVSAEGVGTFEVMEGSTAVVAGAEQYTAWCGEGTNWVLVNADAQ